jgi:hypothetical protein
MADNAEEHATGVKEIRSKLLIWGIFFQLTGSRQNAALDGIAYLSVRSAK